MSACFRLITRDAHALGGSLAKWDAPSFAVLTGIYAAGNFKSHLARLGHQLRNHGVVAVTMVKARVGSAFHRGFYLHRNFAGASDPRVGARAPRKKQATRHIASFAIFALAVFVIQRIADGRGTHFISHLSYFSSSSSAVFFLLPLPTGEKVRRSQSRHRRDKICGRINICRRWNQFGLISTLLVSRAGSCRASLRAFTGERFCRVAKD